MKIVIDDGSNFTKVAYKGGFFAFPSRVIPRVTRGANGGFSSSSYEIGQNRYAVCETGDSIIPTNNKEFQISEHNAVLVHHAIREVIKRTGIKPDFLEILVTLPVEQKFTKDTRENNDYLIERKKNNYLNTQVKYLDGSDTIKIDSVSVVAEGIPAFWFAEANLPLTGKRFLLADIGGTTTDVIVIDNDSNIQDYRSFDFGVLSSLNELRTRIATQEAWMESDITDDDLLTAFHTGKFHGRIEVSHLVDPIKRAFEKEFHDRIVSFKNPETFPDGLICSGGGANLINPDNCKFPVLKTATPQSDNALGAAAVFGVND